MLTFEEKLLFFIMFTFENVMPYAAMLWVTGNGFSSLRFIEPQKCHWYRKVNT